MLKSLDIALKYAFSRFWTHKPVILTHSVTSKCNCECKICDVWRKKNCTNEMSTCEIFQMLNEAKKLNFVSYVVWGGEPLLRSDMLDILQYAHELNLYTSIITNGVNLAEKARRIVETVDLIWVSLDHYSDYHDEMRGRNGSFKKAVEGITRLRREGGRVAINCVLSRLNMDVVGKMADFAQKLGVKIAFDPMEVFQGCNEEYALTSNERRRFFSEILKFKRQGYPILNSQEYLEHLTSNSKYFCAQPQIFIKVTENGKVIPFWCKKNFKVIGDLRKQSLREIISSPLFSEFAEKAKGCCLCKNSSTVEASLFYSFIPLKYNKWNNAYVKFISDYA